MSSSLALSARRALIAHDCACRWCSELAAALREYDAAPQNNAEEELALLRSGIRDLVRKYERTTEQLKEAACPTKKK